MMSIMIFKVVLVAPKPYISMMFCGELKSHMEGNERFKGDYDLYLTVRHEYIHGGVGWYFVPEKNQKHWISVEDGGYYDL